MINNFFSKRAIALILTLSASIALCSGALSEADFFPYENNLILDGMPSSGIGSFATPQRPALLNPASLAAIPQTQAAVDFQRFFWGIGEVLSAGNILYAHHVLNRGWGASIGLFRGGMISTQSYSIHYARRIGRPASPLDETRRIGLFGGATARIRRRVYSESDFRLSDPNDPLFADGTGATALSLGLGMIYRTADWSLQLCADDLNRPNLALEDDVEDRLPLELQVGGEFTLPWEGVRVSPMLSYRSEYGEFEANIDPTIAIRKDYLDGRLELGLFAGRWAVGLGATYYLDAGVGPGARYEISQPTTGIGVPSHRVSAVYRFEPPKPAYPDIVVEEIEFVGSPIVGAEAIIRCRLKNNGLRSADNFPIALFLDDAVIDMADINTLPAGESADVDFDYLPKAEGELKITIRADDTGQAFPDFDGLILELDETNNSASARFKIYGAPLARLDVDKKELRLTQQITVTEDEPIIPIVFFESGSAEIDPRFEPLLANISRRLAANPDTRLTLEGFYSNDDPQGPEGAALADSRARNIASAMIAVEPTLADRIEISGEHDRSRSRAEKEKFEGTRLGKRFIAEENRRVEMRVQPSPPNEWFLRSFDLNSLDIERFHKRLFENPLFEVVVAAPSLDSAYALERSLAKLIGPRFAGRVYSREAKGEEAKVIITAGSILYKPQAFEVPDEELKIEPGFGKSKFELSVEGGGRIASSKIIIEDGLGRIVREFSDAKGLLSTQLWNWTDSKGGLVDPADIYVARAEASDEFGQTASSSPETLTVVLTNSRDISGRLILVQFAFAGAHGEPDYASVRMEQLTREIVNRIQRDGNLDVVIGGHTDVVGVEAGNLKLSERRAEEQFETFRKYIMKIMDFDEEQLSSWLAERNSTMTARGYGSENPYSILRGKGEAAYKIELGNNDLPEGRIINRRVEIEFTPKRP